MSLADEVISAAPGTVSEYAGINLPAGHLWANGQPVSRTVYSRLFSALTVSVAGVTASGNTAITSLSQDLTQLPTSLVGAPISGPGIPAGATVLAVTSGTITLSAAPTASASNVQLVIAPHGVGDGSTTFTVPDRRGRTAVGHDKMGTSAAGRITSGGSGVNGVLLGASGGTETYALSAAQMPAHNHGVTDPGHVHGVTDPGHAHGVSDPGHNHSVNANRYNVGSASGGTPTPYCGGGTEVDSNSNIAAGTGVSVQGAATGVSIKSVATGITTQNNGSGTAHPIVQPSIVMNYIIAI